VTALRVFLARLLGRGRTPSELDSEMAAHLSLLAADYERRGLSPADALATARRHFGPITQIHETYRDQRRLPFLDTLSQDLVYALRQLHRNPAFASAAVLTLALGIGANAAIYQVLDAVVFRALPVRDPAALVQIELLENNRPIHVSYPLYRELAARQQVLEGLFAVSDFPLRQAVLRGRGSLRSVKGSIVTGNYFRVLGVNARAGRVFTEADDRPAASPVIVLSDAFWDREFARSPGALGQVLEINGIAATVIGVAPPDFFGETVGTVPDLWIPMSVQPRVMPTDYLNAPNSSWLSLLGRLRPGVSARQAEAALDPLYRALADLTVQRPDHDYRVQLQSASRGIAELEQRFGRPLWVLIGITGLVLLMTCGNLANLMLGRATARTQEIGVRLALGAGRARIARQLLTESVVLSALGTAAALLLATSGARWLVAWASAAGGWGLSLALEWRHLAFTAAIAVAATCLFALVPAWAATRIDVQSALQSAHLGCRGGRFRNRLGRCLIVAQLSVSLTLLSAAALLVHSLWNLRHQDFGFDAERVVMAEVPLEFTNAMIRRNTALRQPLFDRMNAIPGVRSAAVDAFGPLGSVQYTCFLSTPERPAQPGDFTRRVHISPRYFETIGTPILAGRGITEADRANSPKVVVLSQTAARTVFGRANPLGRFVSADRTFESKDALQVVGVAHDVRFFNPRDPFGFVLYVPLAQAPAPITAVLLRAASDPARLAPTVRSAFHEVDPTLLVGAIRPLAASVEGQIGNERLLALLATCFGLLALALTAVGVYGVIAYSVQRRTREVGIRLALGAGRAAVSRMIMGDVALLALAGTLLGAAGAITATRALRSTLFAFGPADYSLLLAAAAVLLLISTAAGYLPARRAARLDPMRALRQQ
jgi:putative ABC transport system permease protein